MRARCSPSSHTSIRLFVYLLIRLHYSVLSAEGHSGTLPRCSAKMRQEPDVTAKHRASRQPLKRSVPSSPSPLLLGTRSDLCPRGVSQARRGGEGEGRQRRLPRPLRRQTRARLRLSLGRGCLFPCSLWHPRFLLQGGAVPSSDSDTVPLRSQNWAPAQQPPDTWSQPRWWRPGPCSQHPLFCSTLVHQMGSGERR